jgi:T5orf172 domain
MIRIKCQGCGARTIVSFTRGTCQAAACSGCGMGLVEFESLRGFIYVLSHPQVPNLLKIGFTTRQVEERVAELNAATAVPGPFMIEGVFPSSDPEQHEFVVHGMLAESRIESKEFFRVDLKEVLRAVSLICGAASYLRTQDLPNQVEPPEPAGTVSPAAGTMSSGGQARKWGESYIEYLERMRETAH